MPRGRSIQTRERDAQAVDLRRNGLTHRQIATQLGYKSPASVHEAIRRGLQDLHHEAADGLFAMQMDRLDMYRRAALRVLTAKHIAHSNGRVVLYPKTGEPVSDHMPVLHALDRLLRIEAEVNKMNDLYPAAKSRVEVITRDQVEESITALERELAANDPAGHPGAG
jgi:hypothetical protein